MVVGGERHQSTELVATIRCPQPDRHRPWTAGLTTNRMEGIAPPERWSARDSHPDRVR